MTIPAAADNRLLSVTVRASVAAPLAALRAGAEEIHDTPGVAALLELRRTEDLSKVTLVSRAARKLSARRPPGGDLAGNLAAAGAARESGRWPHDGELLLEFTTATARNRFRQTLERRGDPHIDSWSSVPSRHRFPMAVSVGQPWAGLRVPLMRGWNLECIGLPMVPARRRAAAREVHVAVLDTGVDRAHPALAGRIESYVHDGEPGDAGSADDVMGHGTHVCGVIAARVLLPPSVGGICDCRLSVWKIYNDRRLSSAGSGFDSFVVDHACYVRALYDCLDRDVDVINLSLGGYDEPVGTEREAFDRLLDRGVTIVAAMGNYRMVGSPVMYPAAIPGVIAVGASDNNDDAAAFSSGGDHISLCAPGLGIWSTLPRYPGMYGVVRVRGRGKLTIEAPVPRNTHYDMWDCTSAAAPHVTAAAAMLIGGRRGLRRTEVRNRLMRTAVRVRGMRGRRFTRDHGAGRLDLAQAMGS